MENVNKNKDIHTEQKKKTTENIFFFILQLTKLM